MGSIDIASFQNLSPASMMIKIREFSEHVHHKPPPDPSSCNCQFYLQCCIEAAREVWDNENYIFLTVLCIDFSFTEKISLCNLIESILREER